MLVLLALLAAAKFDRDTASCSGGRQFAADHANGLRGERREQLGLVLVGNAAQYALAAGVAAVDHRTELALIVVVLRIEHVVKLIDHERRFPPLNRTVERTPGDIDRGNSARH